MAWSRTRRIPAADDALNGSVILQSLALMASTHCVPVAHVIQVVSLVDSRTTVEAMALAGAAATLGPKCGHPGCPHNSEISPQFCGICTTLMSGKTSASHLFSVTANRHSSTGLGIAGATHISDQDI
jgi:hypothetical protein